MLRPASPTSEVTLIINNIELAIAYILHPFNATDGKEPFAFCEGVTFIGEAGKLRCRRSGFLSRPMQRHPTTSYRRSWEASPPIIARRPSHSAKVVTFIGEAGKLRLLQSGFPKDPFAFCEGVIYTLISCVSAAKKRLNVDSLASLPVGKNNEFGILLATVPTDK